MAAAGMHQRPGSGDAALPDEPHGLVSADSGRDVKCGSLTEWLLDGLRSSSPPLWPGSKDLSLKATVLVPKLWCRL